MGEADDDPLARFRAVVGHRRGVGLQVRVVRAVGYRGELNPPRLYLDERDGAVLLGLGGERGLELLIPAAVIERDVRARAGGGAEGLYRGVALGHAFREGTQVRRR